MGQEIQKEVVLSEDLKTKLFWLNSNFKSANGKSFFPNATDLEMYSDASFLDKGVFCDGVRIGGLGKGRGGNL